MKISRKIPIESLHRNFAYKDGKLFYKINIGRGRIGKEAGTMCRNGYKQVTVDYQTCLIHRVIWAMHNNEWPKTPLDHADGNKLNNKIENLRLFSHGQNALNRLVHRQGREAGFTFKKKEKKWAVVIPATLLPKRGKNLFLGNFKTEEEGKRAVYFFYKGIYANE